MTVNTPEVKWAQNASYIYLTVNLTDAKPTITLTEDKLEYKATSEGKDYAFTLELYQPVDEKESLIAKADRQTFFKLVKKNPGSPWWPRLTKDKLKLFWLKTDFEHWKDEDDDDEDEQGQDQQFSGMDFQSMMQMQGMGGMPGMGGMGGMPGMGGFDGVPMDYEGPDSDDDDEQGDDAPPPLEEVRDE